MIDYDLHERDYRRQPGLSATGAKAILDSPARYRHMVTTRQPYKPAFALGSATHTAILGAGAGIVPYPEEFITPSGNPSTKAAAVAWAQEQNDAGVSPLAPADYERVQAMKEAVLANPTARSLLELPGHREVSVMSELDDIPVMCRFDALTEPTKQGRFGIDLKTSARSVNPETFARSILDFGYDVQQEFYRDVFRASEGEEINFVFIAVEKEAPYLVSVIQLDVVFQQMGRAKAAHARRLYRECKASGIWPGYPEDVQLVAPPVWAAMQHEEKYG